MLTMLIKPYALLSVATKVRVTIELYKTTQSLR